MYQPIVRLFSCDFRVISIRHLPAALPIKRWLSLLNHVTYAHNSGIRETYVLEICPFHTLFSINGLSFYTYANGEQAVAVHASCPSFVVSIDGLLLLHFCKWRTGGEPYMPCVLLSLSPLTDCYFYTSSNGEWAVNRICFMAFLHCLL